MKIKNRESAGNILAETLKDILKNDHRSDIAIIGLPRGGLIIAEIIATKLSCSLGMILTKRLRAPYNEEVAIGAVVEDGTTYLNKSLIEELKITDEYISNELSHQQQEIKKLSGMYYQGKETFLDDKFSIVKNNTIVIVDDGAATGSTIVATIRSLKKRYDPNRLIVAIAVSPKGTTDLLRREGIDHIELIINPSDSNFKSIEQFYQNFDQVSDSQIFEIIHTLSERKNFRT